MSAEQLVLASSSPRRHELLSQLGLSFIIDPARIDEASLPGEDATRLALRLAEAKARDVAVRHPRSLIIGADTVVVRDRHLFGKPRDQAEARETLRRLRGGPHLVVTGLAVVRLSDDLVHTRAVPATVTMRSYTDEEIDQYMATGEPLDKAGAYGAQGKGSALVQSIDGPYLTVVGLPLDDLCELLALCPLVSLSSF